MRAKSVLKPKSTTEIQKDLEFATRDEMISAIVSWIFSNDGESMYDFLCYIIEEFTEDGIWERLAQKVIAEDKDEGTGRWVSLSAEDRKQLKSDPQEWFSEEWSDEEIVEEYLRELSDEQFKEVLTDFIK